MHFGLRNDIIENIQYIFEEFDQVNEVIIYGSRAKGTYKPGSDVDLTIKGKNLDLKMINKISLKIDDLFLPYTFDISVYSQIENPDLIDHIERVGKVFYQKQMIAKPR